MTALRQMISVASAVVLCVTVMGCSGRTASPSPAPAGSPAPTQSAPPSPSPSTGCTAAVVLQDVDRLLAGQDFEAHYLTIGDKFTLSVWLVDPDIDPATPGSGMAASDRQAMARGLSLSYQIVNQIPCTQRVFDQVNPMIVDDRFQHWYKDFLPVAAFAGVQDPTTDRLIAAVEAAGAALQETRRAVPKPVQALASGSCSWSEARATIHAYLGPGDNTAAYLIIGAGLVGRDRASPNGRDDAGVEVQWPAGAAAEATDAQIRERLSHVAEALVCLSPAVDSLEAFVVAPDGRTLVYAIVPGSIIRGRLFPLPPSRIQLYRMAPWPRP